MGIFQDALGDVVGGIERHHLAGHHDVDLLGLVLTDRHRKATAHHIAEHVIGDVVDIVICTVLFKEIDRGDDAAPGAADARFRTAGLHALDAFVAGLEHVLELKVFHRTFLRCQMQNRVLCFGVQDQPGGVGFRVASDDQDLLPEVDKRCERILGGGGLADPPFAVKCDLTQI